MQAFSFDVASPGFNRLIDRMMYIVVIAWMFVVTLMSVVEATASNGSVLGAIVTFFCYGVLPLGLVLYLLGTPLRAKKRKAQEEENQ